MAKVGLKIFLAILGIALLEISPVLATPMFNCYEIEGMGSDIMSCDLNGDGLDDLVLLDALNLSIFYQDAEQGFTRQPQQQFQLDGRPSLIWPARLGRKSESLLMMTSEGVTEFDFTNHTSPPVRQDIIRQKTIVPEAMDETNAMYFPLSAKTGGDWPLLLVPVADGGLQVWQHKEGWREAQFITNAMLGSVTPSIKNPGYAQSFTLSLNIGDVNHDGRDDLMVNVANADGTETYRLYLQSTNGLFNLEPALIYTNTDDWRTTLLWTDINRDGRVDLIKSTSSDEPSFVPGLPSGKVLVAVYIADPDGRIPATPTQVFRKNDWSGYLPIVDVDGDDYTDLVLGYIPIDSREGARNMITAAKFNLTLRLHFFRPGSGLSSDTDYERTVPVYFGRDMGWSLGDLYYDKLISLNGDFNGDGKKDLLVRDDRDNISVYFFNSRETGFSTRPDIEFPCPESMDWWQIRDLNGDGISDLIVKLKGQDLFRIFISQRK